MTKYSQKYIQTRDIDWFAKVSLPDGRNFPIHVASRGNDLPSFVNNKEHNRTIQSLVANKMELPLRYEPYDDVVYVGYDDIQNLTNEEKLYLSSFGEMAHQGFYSFDNIIEDDVTYRLIAHPSQVLVDDILQLLPQWPNKLIPTTILEQLAQSKI